MRSSHLLALLSTLASTTIAHGDTSPYRAAFDVFAPGYNDNTLQKRQNGCPRNYQNCGGLGYNGYCCAPGQNCAIDQGGRIACCPTSIFCTGAVPTTTVANQFTSYTTIPPTQTIGGGGVVVVGGAAYSTVYNGANQVITVLSQQYSDFRSDLGGWYTSFTQQYGPGWTSVLNAQGQYVTTIAVINAAGVAVASTVTVGLVQGGVFVQGTGNNQPTATVTVVRGAGARNVGEVGDVRMCVWFMSAVVTLLLSAVWIL